MSGSLSPAMSPPMSPSLSDGDGGTATYQSILGSLLVALWTTKDNAGVGLGSGTFASGTIDTWTDQVGGAVLPAPSASNRPNYTVDGTAFGGRSVVQTAVTGSKLLRATALTSIAPSGSRPWLFIRGRWRSDSGTTSLWAVHAGSAGSSLAVIRNSPFTQFQGTDVNTLNVNDGSADFGVHSFSAWADGTNLNIDVDGSASSASFSGSLGAALTKIGVGVYAQDGATGKCDFSVGLILICSSYPGLAISNTARALAAQDFPA